MFLQQMVMRHLHDLALRGTMHHDQNAKTKLKISSIYKCKTKLSRVTTDLDSIYMICRRCNPIGQTKYEQMISAVDKQLFWPTMTMHFFFFFNAAFKIQFSSLNGHDMSVHSSLSNQFFIYPLQQLCKVQLLWPLVSIQDLLKLSQVRKPCSICKTLEETYLRLSLSVYTVINLEAIRMHKKMAEAAENAPQATKSRLIGNRKGNIYSLAA